MIGRQIALRRGARDEAEKPFWISFADLMTALMVLFLVSLSVALTRAQEETTRARQAHEMARQEAAKAKLAQDELAAALAKLKRQDSVRDAQVRELIDAIEAVVSRHDGVNFDRKQSVIDFGSRAQFAIGRHELTIEQANVLRRLVPDLLQIIRRTPDVGVWLKRIVAEGFTDETGSYLLNLNLSLQRSQRVLCVLLAKEWPAPQRGLAATQTATAAPTVLPELATISADDELLIRSLFLVGGYSSNSQKASREESRRIELRIEFYQLDEPRLPIASAHGDAGKCALGGRT